MKPKTFYNGDPITKEEIERHAEVLKQIKKVLMPKTKKPKGGQCQSI